MAQEELKDYGPILRRGLIEHLPQLKGAPLSVFIYLTLEADHRTFRVTASVEQIAAATGYSYRAVKYALAALEGKYIVNEGSPNPWHPNTYLIPKYRRAKNAPLHMVDSGANIAPREEGHSGAKSIPLQLDNNCPTVGQKTTDSGANIAPPIIDNEITKEGKCGSARTREGNESSSAFSFLRHLESLTAIWPVAASKYNTPEYASDMAELEACLEILGPDEARRLTEEAYANSPPENRPKWLWQFKRILQDEIRRRKEGNGKARKSARGGGRQAEPEIDRRTREEALAALGNRK